MFHRNKFNDCVNYAITNFKSHMLMESHKKSQTVSAHKLHNIVQSIEFYWLNSPLNQLQILCIEYFAMRGMKKTKNKSSPLASEIVDEKIASRLCINKDIQVTRSASKRTAKVARAYFSKLIYRYFFLIYLFV